MVVFRDVFENHPPPLVVVPRGTAHDFFLARLRTQASHGFCRPAQGPSLPDRPVKGTNSSNATL